MATFTDQLESLNACAEAVEWVNGRSLRKSWQAANRADWMLWLAEKVSIDRKILVLVACDCAETALKYVPKGEDRPHIAIETARNWCNGKATLQQARNAAYAAYGASDADAAAAAAAHAAAAAVAAVVADAHAAAADAYAAAAAARNRAHKRMCKLIRKRIPVELIEAAINE